MSVIFSQPALYPSPCVLAVYSLVPGREMLERRSAPACAAPVAREDFLPFICSVADVCVHFAFISRSTRIACMTFLTLLAFTLVYASCSSRLRGIFDFSQQQAVCSSDRWQMTECCSLKSTETHPSVCVFICQISAILKNVDCTISTPYHSDRKNTFLKFLTCHFSQSATFISGNLAHAKKEKENANDKI